MKVTSLIAVKAFGVPASKVFSTPRNSTTGGTVLAGAGAASGDAPAAASPVSPPGRPAGRQAARGSSPGPSQRSRSPALGLAAHACSAR